MQFEYSAGAIVFRRAAGRLLFLALIKEDNTPDIPKGHIEKGETAEQAAVREAKEETGLDITLDKFFRKQIKYFFVEGKEKIFKTLTIFLSETKDSNVKISYEHAGYKWLTYDEAMAQIPYKNTREVLSKANGYIARMDAMAKLNREYSRLPEKAKGWSLSRRFVPGEGPLDARIMLVGQAPGREEDRSQRPFVGRSGMLLESMLRKIRIMRRNAYITSVVQFFPPENRVPSDDEVRMCIPFLKRQISIIKPKYAILLGNVASSAILCIADVSKNHGKFFEVDGVTYMPTFHPAAVLRLKKLEPLMVNDFRQFKKKIA